MADEGKEATNFAKSQLRALVERIERLEEEKKALADDIREVYAEAKANGFDTKALRAVVRMRGQDAAERQEFEAVVELYRDALGLGGLVDTDLGQAAVREGMKNPTVRKAARERNQASSEVKEIADRAEARARERDLPDVPAPRNPPHPTVAAPPFAITSPPPGSDMPDIPENLRRTPEPEQPRMADPE